jgi:hypothetical protein
VLNFTESHRKTETFADLSIIFRTKFSCSVESEILPSAFIDCDEKKQISTKKLKFYKGNFMIGVAFILMNGEKSH